MQLDLAEQKSTNTMLANNVIRLSRDIEDKDERLLAQEESVVKME